MTRLLKVVVGTFFFQYFFYWKRLTYYGLTLLNTCPYAFHYTVCNVSMRKVIGPTLNNNQMASASLK